MKCRSCGYLSLERAEVCKNCGASQAVTGPVLEKSRGAPPPPVEATGSQLEFGFEIETLAPTSPPLSRKRRRTPPRDLKPDRAAAEEEPDGDNLISFPSDAGPDNAARDGSVTKSDDEWLAGAPFERFPGLPTAESVAPAPVSAASGPDHGGTSRSGSGEGFSRPAFVIQREEGAAARREPSGEPRERAPDSAKGQEAAGLGRRAVALLVDQTILMAIIGGFFFSAFLALRVSGFDTDHFLSAAGLQAAKAPFALLFIFLSLVYHAFFHGSTGRTPGKALAGIMVLTEVGAVPSGLRAVLRWFCAALGLACAGLGLAWALFDPGRRGWADRLSGTVVARVSSEPSGGPPRR